MRDDISPDPRVLGIIAAYGADPLSWPDDERAFVEKALAHYPDLYTAALAEARELDAALNLEVVPEPSIALFENALRAAPKPKTRQTNRRSWLGRTLFPNGTRWPAGAAFASLAMGVVSGYAYASTGTATYSEAEQVYIEAFGYDTYESWLAEETLQ